MAYDLVIKNGVVIDGSGLPQYRADAGVKGGRSASIGRIREGAREAVDAEGKVCLLHATYAALRNPGAPSSARTRS